MSDNKSPDLPDQDPQTQLPGNDDKVMAIVSGEPFVDIPDDLYIPPDALEVILDSFEGPLDLLLYLIRKQNLDILNIPVAKITQQYMQYVELMRHFKLDLAAEYLVMAAMLAEIKSRMLLPKPGETDEEDGEDPRAILIRRLQEYERFRKAAQELDELPRLERDIFVSKAQLYDVEQPIPLPQVNIEAIVSAYELVVERAKRNQNWLIEREVLSVRERMTILLEKLQSRKFLRLEEMFSIDEGRMGLVVSFVAILELVKDNVIIVVQNSPFSPIHIKSVTNATIVADENDNEYSNHE